MDIPENNRLKDFVENIPVGAVYVESQHITLNRAAEKITGYQRHELGTLDAWFTRLHGGRGKELYQQYIADLEAESPLTEYSLSIIRKDGHQRCIEMSVCLFDGHEIWIFSDVTEYMRAEEGLRLREQAIRSTSTGVIIVDARQQDNPAVFVNEAFETISGYSAQEVLGRNLRFLHRDDPDQPGVIEIRNAILSGHEMKTVVRNYRKDGALYWNELTISPVHNSRGELTHFVGVQNDITQRKNSEQALQKSEQRIRAILDTACDAIISIDQRGNIIDINPATETMFGYTQRELLYENISLLMPDPWSYEHDGYIRRNLETGDSQVIGSGRELVAKRKDGSTFPIFLSLSQVDVDLFTGIIRDLSEQKELQKQVLEIAAQEGRRIGQELHDNIQQQLTGLGMMAKSVLTRLEQLSRDNTALSDIASQVSEMAEGLNKSASDVYLLARGLVPVDIDAEGLREALSELSSRITMQYQRVCHFNSDGDVRVDDNFVATHLYRIAQEALNNAIKHSQSKQIEISLRGDAEKITLTVSDHGTGFKGTADAGSGLGIRIMRYRASMIGANVQFNDTEETGMQVVCILPRAVPINSR